LLVAGTPESEVETGDETGSSFETETTFERVEPSAPAAEVAEDVRAAQSEAGAPAASRRDVPPDS